MLAAVRAEWEWQLSCLADRDLRPCADVSQCGTVQCMVIRDEQLTIRFSAEEMQEITKLADEEDRTKGAMVRKLVGEALAERKRIDTTTDKGDQK